MRASLFLVAAIALAACASSGASSNTNPQAAGATNRLRQATAAGDHLTLQFENISAQTTLDVNALRFTCVASVTPKGFRLGDHETATVGIASDTQGACKDGSREVDFLINYVVGSGNWSGDLDVWYSPQSGWTGKIRGVSRGTNLCTAPSGLAYGDFLHDNELIRFRSC